MDNLDLPNLRKLAEGATPVRRSKPTSQRGQSLLEFGAGGISDLSLQMPTADADFHAAASPEAVHALLDRLERAEARLKAAEATLLEVFWFADRSMKEADMTPADAAFGFAHIAAMVEEA
jgi:hypothetical protein